MTTRFQSTNRREPHNEREIGGGSELDIIAVVAHELRHPLAAIEVAVPLMADAPEHAGRAKARGVIERQLIYMRRLVNDLLDAERARRGDVELEVARLDLRSIVNDVTCIFGELVRKR